MTEADRVEFSIEADPEAPGRFVATVDGSVVGHIDYSLIGDDFVVKDIRVDLGNRNMGIARGLVDAMRATGAPSASVIIPRIEMNDSAPKFWGKMGAVGGSHSGVILGNGGAVNSISLARGLMAGDSQLSAREAMDIAEKLIEANDERQSNINTPSTPASKVPGGGSQPQAPSSAAVSSGKPVASSAMQSAGSKLEVPVSPTATAHDRFPMLVEHQENFGDLVVRHQLEGKSEAEALRLAQAEMGALNVNGTSRELAASVVAAGNLISAELAAEIRGMGIHVPDSMVPHILSDPPPSTPASKASGNGVSEALSELVEQLQMSSSGVDGVNSDTVQPYRSVVERLIADPSASNFARLSQHYRTDQRFGGNMVGIVGEVVTFQILSELGFNVRSATPTEDRSGVDFVVTLENGQQIPVQVKAGVSPSDIASSAKGILSHSQLDDLIHQVGKDRMGIFVDPTTGVGHMWVGLPKPGKLSEQIEDPLFLGRLKMSAELGLQHIRDTLEHSSLPGKGSSPTISLPSGAISKLKGAIETTPNLEALAARIMSGTATHDEMLEFMRIAPDGHPLLAQLEAQGRIGSLFDPAPAVSRPSSPSIADEIRKALGRPSIASGPYKGPTEKEIFPELNLPGGSTPTVSEPLPGLADPVASPPIEPESEPVVVTPASEEVVPPIPGLPGTVTADGDDSSSAQPAIGLPVGEPSTPALPEGTEGTGVGGATSNGQSTTDQPVNSEPEVATPPTDGASGEPSASGPTAGATTDEPANAQTAEAPTPSGGVTEPEPTPTGENDPGSSQKGFLQRSLRAIGASVAGAAGKLVNTLWELDAKLREENAPHIPTEAEREAMTDAGPTRFAQVAEGQLTRAQVSGVRNALDGSSPELGIGIAKQALASENLTPQAAAQVKGLLGQKEEAFQKDSQARVETLIAGLDSAAATKALGEAISTGHLGNPDLVEQLGVEAIDWAKKQIEAKAEAERDAVARKAAEKAAAAQARADEEARKAAEEERWQAYLEEQRVLDQELDQLWNPHGTQAAFEKAMAEINAPPVAIEAPGGQGQIGTTSGGSGQIGTGNGDQGQIGTGGASGPAGQIGTDGGAGSGQGQLPNPGQGSGAGGQPELPKPEERGRRGPGLLLGVLRSGAEAIFGPSSGSVELREPVDVETNAVPGSTTAPGGALSGDDNTSSIPVGTVSQQTRLGARQRGDTPLSVSAKPSVPTPSIGDSRPQPSAIGADFGTSSRGADSVGEGPRIEPAPARPAVSETPHSSVSGASSRSGSLPSGNPSSVYEPDGIFPPGQAVPIETEGPSYIQGPTLLIRGSSPHEAYQALEKLNEAKGQAQGRLGSSDEGGKAGPLSDTPTMVVPVYVGRGGNTAPAAPGTPQLEAGEVTETDIVPVSSGDSGIPDGGAVEIVFDPRGYDGNIQGPVVPVDASSILGTGHSGSSMPVTSVDDSLSDGDTGADSEE